MPALRGSGSSRAEAQRRRAVESLQTHTLQANEGEGECAVCLGEFVQGQPVKVLPCGHGFHSACIDKWLLGQTSEPTCPLCKAVAIRPEAAAGAVPAVLAAAAIPVVPTEVELQPAPSAWSGALAGSSGASTDSDV